MSKKNFRQSADDFFNANTPSTSSWDATDSQIYGGEIFDQLAQVDAQVARLQKISIFSIIPDPAQPRRAVPSAIRHFWDGTPQGVALLFQKWWEAIQEERNAPFDLGGYLAEEEHVREGDTSIKRGVLEESLMTLIALAASIRRDGLTNPITIAPIPSGGYQLETGERRWLAFHLLHAWYDGANGKPDERDQWEKIPSREVDRVNVWRQASENSARANLNTISRARQFALLMMNLHANKHAFKPLNAFSHERQFYAQASDLNTPAGKSELLLNAMGVKHRSSLARLRAMFDLPDEVWQVGDDQNWSEEWLYEMARLEQEKALARMHQLLRNTANLTNREDEEEAIKIEMDLEGEPLRPGTKRHFARLTRLVDRAERGKYRANSEALRAIRELQTWLTDQETRIRKLLD